MAKGPLEGEGCRAPLSRAWNCWVPPEKSWQAAKQRLSSGWQVTELVLGVGEEVIPLMLGCS